MRPPRLRPAGGTYALVFEAPDGVDVDVGAAGRLRVGPGALVYVGSALGPGGVRGRVLRHARADKRLRWHVDHVGRVARLVEVWVAYDPRRRECRWADALTRLRGARAPLRGLGSSDCRCATHLLWLPRRPSRDAFRRSLRRDEPVHPRVLRWWPQRG